MWHTLSNVTVGIAQALCYKLQVIFLASFKFAVSVIIKQEGSPILYSQ